MKKHTPTPDVEDLDTMTAERVVENVINKHGIRAGLDENTLALVRYAMTVGQAMGWREFRQSAINATDGKAKDLSHIVKCVNEYDTLKLKAQLIDRLPFCSDHRDKVHNMSCRECEIERLKYLNYELVGMLKSILKEHDNRDVVDIAKAIALIYAPKIRAIIAKAEQS